MLYGDWPHLPLPPLHLQGLGATPSCNGLRIKRQALANKLRKMDHSIASRQVILARCRTRRGLEARRCEIFETKKLIPLIVRRNGVQAELAAVAIQVNQLCGAAFPIPQPIPVPVSPGQAIPPAPPAPPLPPPVQPPVQPRPPLPPLPCEPGYIYSDLQKGCIRKPGTPPFEPFPTGGGGAVPFPVPELPSAGYYGQAPGGGFEDIGFDSIPQAPAGQAPVMSAPVVAGGPREECAPDFQMTLPREYRDQYGPMKVLRVVCASSGASGGGGALPQGDIVAGEMQSFGGGF